VQNPDAVYSVYIDAGREYFVGIVATVSNFLLKLFGDWHPTLLLAFRNLSPTCRFFLWKRKREPPNTGTYIY
jgi:hypothetical protein